MRGIAGVLLLCLILVGSIACNLGDTDEASQQLVEVVQGDLTLTVSGSGNIDVSNEASIAFSSVGKIDKIYVDEGDKVNKGDALAKLDTSALELALIQAQATHDEVAYNLNQLRTVLHASYERIKVAEAQLEAAEQAVAEAQKQLDEATIIAPFDGVAASVDADEGDNVSTLTTIVHLIDLTSLELNAEVDEIDIADVEPGQRVIIDIDALPALQL
jgi:RND family efflux transporter MFP subunit